VTVTAPDLYEIGVTTIDGRETTLAEYRDRPMLVVNVASKCGNAPQYAQLEELHREYGDRGLAVLGFPCNQFLGQEPGSNAKILDYCTTTWGVTFPMFAKIKVNGRHAHPLYQLLKTATDDEGTAGRVAWNFEKFLVLPDGRIRRFRPSMKPDDPAIVGAIEAALA